jgi:predicted transcriptional regulator of viral defense system
MKKLLEKIKLISKSYFSFSDLRKISPMEEHSLKVSLSRLIKKGALLRLSRGIYATDLSSVEWEKLALELYSLSYFSFEWALAYHKILSQQPINLTLATTKRSRTMSISNYIFIYHHIRPELFWGYEKRDNIMIADPEKSFLDLAYLSINGYAKLDASEMNLKLLDKKRIKLYLKKFDSKRLTTIVKNILFS